MSSDRLKLSVTLNPWLLFVHFKKLNQCLIIYINFVYHMEGIVILLAVASDR